MSRLTVVTEALMDLMDQVRAEEGWCPLCKARVGNTLECNDTHHKSWCALPKARIALKKKGEVNG
jgi:hypothetical protein